MQALRIYFAFKQIILFVFPRRFPNANTWRKTKARVLKCSAALSVFLTFVPALCSQHHKHISPSTIKYTAVSNTGAPSPPVGKGH